MARKSKAYVTIECNKCLGDTQIFECDGQRVEYNLIYRWVRMSLLRTALPTRTEQEFTVQLDDDAVDDDMELSDVWVESWDNHVADAKLRRKVQKIIDRDDDDIRENLEQLGFENVDGYYSLVINAEFGHDYKVS